MFGGHTCSHIEFQRCHVMLWNQYLLHSSRHPSVSVPNRDPIGLHCLPICLNVRELRQVHTSTLSSPLSPLPFPPVVGVCYKTTRCLYVSYYYNRCLQVSLPLRCTAQTLIALFTGSVVWHRKTCNHGDMSLCCLLDSGDMSRPTLQARRENITRDLFSEIKDENHILHSFLSKRQITSMAVRN